MLPKQGNVQNTGCDGETVSPITFPNTHNKPVPASGTPNSRNESVLRTDDDTNIAVSPVFPGIPVQLTTASGGPDEIYAGDNIADSVPVPFATTAGDSNRLFLPMATLGASTEPASSIQLIQESADGESSNWELFGGVQCGDSFQSIFSKFKNYASKKGFSVSRQTNPFIEKRSVTLY